MTMVREREHLRICLLSYRCNPHSGGQGVYVRNLARSLVALGHRVEVICGPPAPRLDVGVPVTRMPSLDLYDPANPFRRPSLPELADPLNLLEWFGVSTMGFPEPFLFGIRSFRHLRGRLHHFDILHDNQSLSYGLWILKKRMPVIATVHHPIAIDRDVAVKSTHSCWKKFKQLRWYSFVGMQNRVTRTLPHLITVSRRSREDFRRILDLPADRFRIIPNGVDSSRFHPLPHLSREPGRLVVTSSADIPLKGLTYLLHAVADLSRNRDLKLVIIGSPKKNGLVKRTVRDLNLSRRVHFTGRIGAEGFAEQYARASLAVVPSIYEGFGLPAIEAMSCGVPVISTTGGALPEVVGKAGILVPPADARALRDAIAFLLDHPAQASALGQAGLQRVRRHFTWENTARLTVEAYREAIVAHHRF